MSTADREFLVRRLTELAEVLDAAGGDGAGGYLRRAATIVATAPPDDVRRCEEPDCANELGDDPRQEYCSGRCKKRASRARLVSRIVTDVDDGFR